MGGRGVTEPNLSANCEVGKSAGREGNRWRMANSDWRIVFFWRAMLLHCRKVSLLNYLTPHFAPDIALCNLK